MSVQIGDTYSQLTVIAAAPRKNGRNYFQCRCSCGNTLAVEKHKLVSGHTRSCGCYKIRLIKERSITHGRSRSRVYGIWIQMRDRCNNPENNNYSRYGGRGITVCERWENNFDAFLNDMGEPPTEYQLERIDNNGPYSPDNCRWATHQEQCNNRTTTLYFTYKGMNKSAAEWAREVGMGYNTLRNRIVNLGWPIEKAMTTPPRKTGREKG